MPLQTLEFRPGIVSDDTVVASEPFYQSGNRVRFVRGRPQTIGGWSSRASGVEGVCRALLPVINRTRDKLLGIGTHSHLQILKDGVLHNVTPAGLPPGDVDASGAGGAYGMGLYGTGAYGQGAVGARFLRTWSLERWGDSILALPRGGTLYEWAGNVATPAAAVAGAPAVAEAMFVDPNRFIVLLGTIDQGTGQFDPMLVRWGDQDSRTTWTATSTNAAGQLPLSDGGRLVGGIPGSPSLIWTDTALYQMRLTTGDEIFSIPRIGRGCGLIGPNGAAERDGRAFWMSPQGQFFGYAGGVPEPLDCPVRAYVFDNLNMAQADKVACGINGAWNEVWWFYPDQRDGLECSRYVAYNWMDRTWSLGEMARTAWVDASVFAKPIAATPGGLLYDHETGQTADGGAIGEELISGAVDLGDGDALFRIDALHPDMHDQVGVAQVSVLMRNDPQGAEREIGPFAVSGGVQRIPFQAQGRHARIKVRGAGSPSFWRLGAPRFEIKPTGMRS